jgi:hypothetical protein
MTARFFATTTGARRTVNHLFDPRIHGLLQLADNAAELASGQTFVAGWTGGIGFFEPTEGFVD